MQVGEDVIGVLHAMSSKRRLFTVAEMELLYTIANQAAFAVVNAMLYQEARSKSHEMRRYFRRVAQAIGSALEAQNLPQLMADLAVEIMRADRCAIYRRGRRQSAPAGHQPFPPHRSPGRPDSARRRAGRMGGEARANPSSFPISTTTRVPAPMPGCTATA